MESKLLYDRYRDACMFLEWTIHEWQEDDNVTKALLCDLMHKEIHFYFGELDALVEKHNISHMKSLKKAKDFHIDLQRFEEDSQVTKKLVCHCFRVIFQGESAKIDIDYPSSSSSKLRLSTVINTSLSIAAEEDPSVHDKRKGANLKRNTKALRKSENDAQGQRADSGTLTLKTNTQESNPESSQRAANTCGMCLKPLHANDHLLSLPCFHEVHSTCIDSLSKSSSMHSRECCWMSAEILSLSRS